MGKCAFFPKFWNCHKKQKNSLNLPTKTSYQQRLGTKIVKNQIQILCFIILSLKQEFLFYYVQNCCDQFVKLIINNLTNFNSLQNGSQIQRHASSHYISPIAQQQQQQQHHHTTKAFINQSEYHVIELRKHQSSGFGFSIRGGKEFNIPLFVLKLAVNGTAALDGRLQVGDQILEINSQDAYNMTHGEAIERIKMGGNAVTLLVRRTGMPPPSITDIIAVNSSVQQQPIQHQQYIQQQQHQPQILPSLSTNNLNNGNGHEAMLNNQHQLRSKSPYLTNNGNNASTLNINQNIKTSFNSSSTLANRNY
jgi:hypothetical protein